MVSYNGTWSGDLAVTSATTQVSQYEPRLAVEGDNLVLIYRNTNVSSHIYFRSYNGSLWSNPEMVSAAIGTTLYTTPDIDLVGAKAHAIWFEILTPSLLVRYHSNDLDQEVPNATVTTVTPYWMDAKGVDVNWEVFDDYGVEQVTLQYRFSKNNADWGRWTAFKTFEGLTARATEGQARFVPTDGEAWYEFRAWATDLSGKFEGAPYDAEGKAAYDRTPPNGTLVIEGGAAYTGNTTVTLNLTYSDFMTDLDDRFREAQFTMRFSNDGLSWSDWEDATGTKEWDLTLGRGSKTVYAQVRDASGLSSPTLRDSIIVDTDDPNGTIVINDGDEWTTSRDVTLTLTYDDTTSGVSKVRFMEEAVGGDEPWEDPVETKEWTLPEGDGMVTVYFQVMDNATRTSEVYSAQIGLDTMAPTGSIIMGGGDTVTSESIVTLTLTYEDATSGVSKVRFMEEAVGGDEPWENPVDTKEWDLGDTGGEHTVYYQVMDIAGHVSEVYSASIVLDRDDPTGAIALQDGATVVKSATVMLALTFADATSEITGIRVLEDAIGGDEPWENPVETLEFTLSAGDGEKTIYLQVVDAAGRESQVYSVTFTVDTGNPFLESADPDDGEAKVGLDTAIVVRFNEAMDQAALEAATELTWVDDTGASQSVAFTVSWSPDGLTATLTPSEDLAKGTEYTLAISEGATDTAGNTLYPAIDYTFTTEGSGNGGGDGNGDGGDEDGGNTLLIIVAIAVVAMAAVMGMMFMRGRSGQ
jgi:hypothetical protein